MVQYFLHAVRHGIRVVDGEGGDFDDLARLREEAIEAARHLMASDIREGKLDLSSSFEIEDEDGRVVLSLPFTEAIEVRH